MGSDVAEERGDSADVDLMRLVADGGEDALASLYDRYATVIFRTAYRLVGDRAVAEEVVQEAFLALWDRGRLFDPDRGSVGAWLTAIARNRAVDRLRAAARRPQTTAFSTWTGDGPDDPSPFDWLVASGEAVAAGTPEPTPEAVVVRTETVAELAKVLAALPDEERQPILLAYRHGLSQSEIAARLGWPLGTVKTRSRRALHRLRSAVEAGEASEAEPADGAARAGAQEPCCGAA